MNRSMLLARVVFTLAGVFAFESSAQAFFTQLTVNKCLSGQVKAEGKSTAAYTGCYGKNAAKPDAGDLSTCTGKASTKLVDSFTKIEKKPPCPTIGDGPSRRNDTATFASSNDTFVGGPTSKCNAAKQKTVGKYVAAIANCYSKAAAKDPGVVSSGTPKACIDKALGKFVAAIGKAETKGTDCTNLAQAGALQSAADAYLDAQVCLLDPANPECAPPCQYAMTTVDPGADADCTATSCDWISSGGVGTVDVTVTPTDCPWRPVSNDVTWLTIGTVTPPPDGSGSSHGAGSFSYTVNVLAHASPNRTGNLILADLPTGATGTVSVSIDQSH